MKGTIGRAPTLTADNSRIEQLRNSEKDRAEHLMIVDLMRNDLGKIAQIGSVNVRNLFGVETYETVHQMVSTIDAKLLPGITLAGVLTALFPSGSVTGAPKVASMALIKGIETRCRAIYCGSIGFVKPGGDCMFNVGIRTVLVNSETLSASCGVGGAIVWDSRPDQEWNEALLKSRFLTKHRSEFALLESVLLNDGEYVYLDRHMRRLTDSTSYFGFKIYPNAIIEGLAKINTKNARGSVNVRIIAHSDGHFETMAAPVSPFEIEPLIVSVSDQPIDCADPLFYHKTTNRRPYEDRLAMFPACSEVLLVNTRQEVTEFTIGNIVVELDGELWTPPIYCGLLPGILREVMIEECVIRERVLTVNDIRHASRVWRINSVRGWTPVQFKELVQKI
jgi:para-aminobenzoate synthetase/4-amino-4-deoxychorismate lyase